MTEFVSPDQLQQVPDDNFPELEGEGLEGFANFDDGLPDMDDYFGASDKLDFGAFDPVLDPSPETPEPPEPVESSIPPSTTVSTQMSEQATAPVADATVPPSVVTSRQTLLTLPPRPASTADPNRGFTLPQPSQQVLDEFFSQQQYQQRPQPAVAPGMMQQQPLGPVASWNALLPPGQLGAPPSVPPLPAQQLPGPFQKDGVTLKKIPPPGAKISHRRNNRIFSASEYRFYNDLPVRTAQPEGPFKYAERRCADGSKQITSELMYSMRFTAVSLIEYLLQRKREAVYPRLWVQHTPTFHNSRFINPFASHKCRMKGCQSANYTINRGQFQIAIDEFPDETGLSIDPFHVFAYVHLYCLEKACHDELQMSLGYFMRLFDVQPDTRVFPKEDRNPMTLDRDGAGHELTPVYYRWRMTFVDPHPTDVFIHEAHFLSSWLTNEHLRRQTPARQLVREARGGNDISQHRGNLRKAEAARQKLMRQRKLDRQRASAAAIASRDEEDDDDVQIVGAWRTTATRRPAAGYHLRDTPARRQSSATQRREQDEADINTLFFGGDDTTAHSHSQSVWEQDNVSPRQQLMVAPQPQPPPPPSRSRPKRGRADFENDLVREEALKELRELTENEHPAKKKRFASV